MKSDCLREDEVKYLYLGVLEILMQAWFRAATQPHVLKDLTPSNKDRLWII